MCSRLAAVLALALSAFSAPAPLTTAFQVHRLTPAEAAKSQPVLLKGVITYYFREWSGFSLQDSTDPVYVSAGAAAVPPLHIGQLVEVEGRTNPGSFAPSV